VANPTQRSLLVAVIAIVSLAPYLAIGQELEEIVVTAERRETTELKTPISIEVFTADALAADQLKSVSDLENATPNLTINTTGFTVQSVNIRGIGNSVVNPNIQPGVAVFQDDLLMAETVVLQQGFLDIASIEVLRGPQGTFVGQSSTGGAIRINAVRPDFNGVSGFFDAAVASQNGTKFSGAITLPLTDTVSTRFAFNREHRDSYFRNIGAPVGPTRYEGGRQPGKVDDSNLRASILWEPNEKLSVLGRIELNTSETDALAPYQPNRATYTNPNDPTGLGQSQYAAFAVPGNDPYVFAWNVPNTENKNQSDRYSMEVRRSYGRGLTFRSLTGYQHNNLRTADDPDATNVNGGYFLNNVGPTNDYWTQEFDLLSPETGKFTWILGTSWFRRTTPVNIRSDNNLCGYNGATGVVTPCPPIGALPIQTALLTIDTTQQHAGLFGQLTWQASDKFELQFGARQSWDHNSDEQHIFVALNTQVIPGTPTDCPNPDFTAVLPAQGVYRCFPANPGLKVPYKDSTPTYKVGVNWTPTDNQFIYAFYARGYKSGGINNGLPFLPETVDDVEIGWKGTIADKRLQVQVGAFDMDYKNMQQPAFLVRPFSSGQPSQANAIQNIGASTVRGVEASLNGAFGEFNFDVGAGYVESDLGGITTVDSRLLSRELFLGNNNYVPGCDPGQTPVVTGGIPNCFDYSTSTALKSLSGASNLYSPKLSYNLSLNYGFSVGGNGRILRPRLAFTHIDESYASLFQSDAFFRIDPRDLVNLSLSLETETWELQAYCNNCTDEHYIAAVEGGTGNRIIYGDPESIGLRFHKRF
jgi:iron complex outermembrane receptor protein